MSTSDVVRQVQSTENYDPSAKQKAAAKLSRIPVKVQAAEVLKKPDWIRVKAGSPSTRFYEIKDVLRANKLVTVCEEASCPNIGECFGKGTATFMIMGDKCTRRCPFCDVGHGRPDPLDVNEPENLAKTIAQLKLKYVVITSVDRDDLRDGGAQHCADREKHGDHDAHGGNEHGRSFGLLVEIFRFFHHLHVELAIGFDAGLEGVELRGRQPRCARPLHDLRAPAGIADQRDAHGSVCRAGR